MNQCTPKELALPQGTSAAIDCLCFMRIRIFTYILLLAWNILVFKPLLVYAQYVFFNDFVSTTLCVKRNETNNCCKGKCHLQKQLAQSHVPQEGQSQSSQKKVPHPDSKEFLVVLTKTDRFEQFTGNQTTPHEIPHTLEVYHSIFVPPKI